jgi:hypothetical protein
MLVMFLVALPGTKPEDRPMIIKAITELFWSWVAVRFGAVQDEDGLHDRGRAAGAAAKLGQDFQVSRVALARSPRARILAWLRLTAF